MGYKNIVDQNLGGRLLHPLWIHHWIVAVTLSRIKPSRNARTLYKKKLSEFSLYLSLTSLRG